MEQQDLHVDLRYIKGFNGGYLLAKHDPELLSKLGSSHNNKENSFFAGLKEGSKEYAKGEKLLSAKSKTEKGQDFEKR